MTDASTSSLLDAVRQYRLLEPAQNDELGRLQRDSPTPKALAAELIRRSWLTPFQANLLLQGRGQELLLGSYVLLEKLGEGGMGQVFKAKNWKLGRIVALKLIRKERLDNPDAIRRFEREVRAAAALSHPNIVHAHDADQIDGTHLLVMEHVEGAIDLSQLVKKQGSLSVEQACDYVRQAALGLQHAHERGMVHRDIKPANLLLSANGRVKVLDMGLARIDRTAADEERSSTMTQEGAVMGTPDYIAPEQAQESHTVDIRADLYSLGCTLYFLLSGRVPFPGGSLIDKLFKHRLEEPQPVEEVRPEVPASLARLVRKLMAKKPEDRYQSPAEVATALASLATVSQPVDEEDRTIAEGSPAVAVGESSNATLDQAWADVAQRGDTGEGVSPQQGLRADERQMLLYSVTACAVLLSGIALLWFFLRPPDKKRPGPGGSPVASLSDAARRKQIADLPPDAQAKAVSDWLKERNPDFNGAVEHEVKDGTVVSLKFRAHHVTDLLPLRALPGLSKLTCSVTPGRPDKASLKSPLTDLSPLQGMHLSDLDITGTSVSDLSPLRGMKLKSLELAWTEVSDLSPLASMPLTKLSFWAAPVADLTPLSRLPLESLGCGGTKITSLAPLRGMKLKVLHCYHTSVSDLSPLKGIGITHLYCGWTPVSDLSPLAGEPLHTLDCEHTTVNDLTPMARAPLRVLHCDFRPYRDGKLLREVKTLLNINNKPVGEFWNAENARQDAFDKWCKKVAGLPVASQIDAVAAELKKLNPGFDGKVRHRVVGGRIVELVFSTHGVKDITPVRAFSGLTHLYCTGTNWAKRGDLADLSPLTGMKLILLNCGDNEVADLSPLKGMNLDQLHCAGTPVSDLSPLQGMPLYYLTCGGTPVKDLSPLRGSKIDVLWINYTKVTDLSPLEGVPLTFLSMEHTGIRDISPLKKARLAVFHCNATLVSDLAPLKEMPLKEIVCDPLTPDSTRVLRSSQTLQKINGKPARELWKEVDAREAAFEAWRKPVAALSAKKQVEAVAARLKELNPGFDGKVTPTIEGEVVTELQFLTDNVKDITPVRALTKLRTLMCGGTDWGKGQLADLWPLKDMKLTVLRLNATRVSNLSPLKEMKLTVLWCDGTQVSDLTPLKGMKLTYLKCAGTPVSDLSPLKDMKLSYLNCWATKVSDLSPLRGMMLTELHCGRSPVADLSALKGMPLQHLTCDFKPARDAAILRSIKTLVTINGKPAKEFWKEVDAKTGPSWP